MEQIQFSNDGRENPLNLKKIVLFLGLILIGSIILSGAVSAASLATSPQPKFHTNNNNTGLSQYKGPQTNDTKWNYPTKGSIESSPTIGSDGTVYIGSDDDNLYATNPNGTKKWSYKTGASIKSTPAIGSDGTIYVGSDDDYLYAMNPTGTMKWRYKTGDSVQSSPAIGTDGTIYFGSNDTNLYALNPNGTLKWKFATGDIIYSSPAIASDGTIYFGSGDMNLYALNPNGSEKWKYTTSYPVFSSPAIGSDGTIYFGSLDNYIYALNPNGTLKWRVTTVWFIYSSPAIGSDGTIYFGSWDKHLYAYNPDGTKKWSYLAGAVIYSSPVIGSDGTIYFGDFDKKLYALNPNGSLKWTYTTNGYIPSSPAIGSDGTLYFGDEDGKLYAIKDIPVAPKVLGSSPGYGALNVALNQVIHITFNEAIKMGTKSWIEFKTMSGTAVPFKTSINGSTLYITPTSQLKSGTQYMAVLHSGAVMGMNGIALAAPNSVKFTTDTTPIVKSVDPSNGAQKVALNKVIMINFNKPIKLGSNPWVELKTASGVVKTFKLSVTGNTLYIKPTTPLTKGTTYMVAVHSNAVVSLTGVSLSAPFSTRFTT